MINIVELLEHTDNTFTHVMYIPDITTLNNVIDHITILTRYFTVSINPN
jgi:hypothetical protein